MKSVEYLEKTIEIIDGDRASDYGDKTINHQNIAGLWSTFLGHKVTAQQAAVCMLLVKVARLKHKRTEDCYIDMAGYAAIAGEIQDTIGWKDDEDEGTRKGRKTAEYIKKFNKKKNVQT
jgi:hypothetical protein